VNIDHAGHDMANPANMAEPKTVRFGIPGCDWQIPFVGIENVYEYREQFWLHCIESHELPEGSLATLDLNTLTMELLRRDSQLPG
jgi:hypothetical protein